MPGNITFQTDSSDLNPQFFDVLNSVSLVLKEYDKTVVEVVGHEGHLAQSDHGSSLADRRRGPTLGRCHATHRSKAGPAPA